MSAPGAPGDLDGARALVTGGASGIGLAVARVLRARGARVLLVDVDAPALVGAAAELACGQIEADVGSPEDWDRVARAVREGAGGLDLAFLNAGVATGARSLDALTLEQYRRTLSVNVDGVVFGVRACTSLLEGSTGPAAIVATASVAGLVGVPDDPVYALTKHAIIGFVRSMAEPLAARGIRINALCPSFTDTPMLRGEIRAAALRMNPDLLSTDDVVAGFMEAVWHEPSGAAILCRRQATPLSYRFRGVPAIHPATGTGSTD